jgi:hypothetical protein
MQEETVVFWLFTFVIAGGVFVIVNALKYRAKILEMAHRERLAMIERGLKPTGPLLDLSSARPARARSSRMMSGGIVIVGFGLALATVISFTSRELGLGVGIGGAVAILGAAFIVTAYVKTRLDVNPGEPGWPPLPRLDDQSMPSESSSSREKF